MRTFGIAILCALVAGAGCGAPRSAPDPSATVAEAPADVIASAVKEHKGQVVLLDFWATWCPPCRARFPHFVETHKKYKGQGLVCVSVNMDQVWPRGGYNKARVLEFLQDRGAAFPNFIATGDDGALTKHFGLGRGIPYMTLFDKTGARVWDDAQKDLEDDELDRLIEKELAK